MSYTFGNTLLCQSFKDATESSKNYNVNCVIADGTQIRKRYIININRGDVYGGYINPSIGPALLHQKIEELLNNKESKINEYGLNQKMLSECENVYYLYIQEYIKIENIIEKLSRDKINISDSIKRKIGDLNEFNTKLFSLKNEKNNKEKIINQLESDIKQKQSHLNQLLEDKKQPLLKELSIIEKKELDEVINKIQKLAPTVYYHINNNSFQKNKMNYQKYQQQYLHYNQKFQKI